jgi:Lar family restriction alleviation protein
MNEKKPLQCPFCEGEARLQRWRRTYGYYVICKKCGCRTPVYQYQYDSKEKRREDAINTWNTRVPMEKIVERLDVMREKPIELCYDVPLISSIIEIVKEGGLND